MIEFVMPSLGADMEEGTLVEWWINPGDEVQRGQVVCVVETQKGEIEVEIWNAGTVHSLVAVPGQKIPVGGVMALIQGTEEAEPAVTEPGAAASPAEATSQPTEAATPSMTTPPPASSPSGKRLRISPAARKRAAELGVDPATVSASGPRGEITLADIELSSSRNRQAAMRDAIATAMARSNREIPHYYLGNTLIVESAIAWLEAHNSQRPMADRLLFAVLQLRAVALALRDVPALSGWYIDGRFRPADGIHLGVAISLRGGGLVAPALRDADHMDMDTMMTALRDLLARARAGQLRSSELTDTSLTVTNLGDLGVESVYGVIYPPQVALVGFGRVTERPWIDNGNVIAARCLHASLAADHRVTDGATGARFLTRMADYLQDPESLWKT